MKKPKEGMRYTKQAIRYNKYSPVLQLINGKLLHSPEPILYATTPISSNLFAAALENGVDKPEITLTASLKIGVGAGSKLLQCRKVYGCCFYTEYVCKAAHMGQALDKWELSTFKQERHATALLLSL